ncbi:MAG: hypothetical protein ACYDHT_13875, partial [Solirubrobacteraceae bacterium]
MTALTHRAARRAPLLKAAAILVAAATVAGAPATRASAAAGFTVTQRAQMGSLVRASLAAGPYPGL